MKKLSLLIFVLVLWVLAACQSASATPDAASPDVIATEEQAVEEATEEVSADPTGTPIPATEPAPADEGMPDIAATVMALQEPRVLESSESPDGLWRVDIIVYDCIETGPDTQNALDRLVLVDLSDNSETVLDEQPLYCGGLGAFGLGGRFWSENSRYFYYTNAREGQPDGGITPWQPPIFRLDVENGVTEGMGAGAPSPDGSLYATWNGPSLEVWDLNTGEITPLFGLPVDQTPGSIVWSPEGDEFVYLYWQFMNGSPIEGTTYIGIADLEQLMPTLLIETQDPGFAGLLWQDPTRLSLTDWQGEAWTFVFATAELSQ